jgi:imidazolonepropionase-like amidohydrolase
MLKTLQVCLLAMCFATPHAFAQVAVRGETVYTMAGPAIKDGVVVIKDGKISAVGKAGEVQIPEGFKVLTAKVVTPGLVDAHSVVGLAGMFNHQKSDQDQLEASNPIQPELRALDAYNAQEELIEWVRSFGVTTLHTGHAPGELISGQTLIVKTVGQTVEDAVMVKAKAIAATLSPLAEKERPKSPGTRGKMMSMLRAEFLKAQEYLKKQAAVQKPKADNEEKRDDDKKPEPPPRDLKLEALGQVLKGELPLMITCDRAQDISSALRLAKEFKIKLWLDGASEAYLLIDEIKAAKVPVILHATMSRAVGENENQSFETAAKLVKAGIPVALQSGYESYVPKTRVVLFEVGMAAANGLTFEQALGTITIEAARILGIEKRVGSLEVGKDGDVALYDGDPFEYTSHCIGVVISGQVVSDVKR